MSFLDPEYDSNGEAVIFALLIIVITAALLIYGK